MIRLKAAAGRASAALVVLTFALAAAPAGAQVARDTARLNPSVVTASRTQRPQVVAPVSTTVIVGDDLRARGIRTVRDALRDVPGAMLVQAGSPGATTSLFMRGGESDYVKVLIDGVPVNEPGGAFDFANLSTESIDRIEVVRGPSSVIYGSDAVTGVIQIFTRDGRSGTDAQFFGGYGSENSREISGSAQGRDGAWSWGAGTTRLRTEGILPFNNQHRHQSWNAAVRVATSPEGDLRFSAQDDQGLFHYPTDGSGVPVDSNARRNEHRRTISASATQPVGTRVRLNLAAGQTEIDARNVDEADGPHDTLGFFAFRGQGESRRRLVEARTDLGLVGSLVLSTGAEWNRQEDRSFTISESEFGTSASDTLNRARENAAAFIQLAGDVGSRASFSLGARRDENQRFGTFDTWRAGVGVSIHPTLQVRAAAGTAFKEPTFFEQFATGFVDGNPDLLPERTRSREVGADLATVGGRWSLSATWFEQKFRDMVQYAFDPAGPDYSNVASASADGLEVEARIRLSPWLSVRGGHSWLRSRVTDAGAQAGQDGATFMEGNRLLRRPTRTASAGADLQSRGGALLSLRAHRIGERDDRDFTSWPAEPVQLSAYTTVDVNTELPLTSVSGSRLALTARVTNALDERYQPIFGFAAPGRQWMVGARVSAR